MLGTRLGSPVSGRFDEPSPECPRIFLRLRQQSGLNWGCLAERGKGASDPGARLSPMPLRFSGAGPHKRYAKRLVKIRSAKGISPQLLDHCERSAQDAHCPM